MKEVKNGIKTLIGMKMKRLPLLSGEDELYTAKTINELLRAWHNTERPHYKRRPYKRGGKYENRNNAEQ